MKSLIDEILVNLVGRDYERIASESDLQTQVEHRLKAVKYLYSTNGVVIPSPLNFSQ